MQSKEQEGRQRRRRYDLLLSEETLKWLKEIADQEQRSQAEMIRRFIAMGVYIYRQLEKNPGAAIIMRRENGKEKELVIL